jgi:hypothetical protein
MTVPTDTFEPDLVVTTDDGTELVLVVEVKARAVRLAETESQLKEYMLAMRCPVGLLATPSQIRLYYDQYLSASENSVQLVGEYAAPSPWAAWFGKSLSVPNAGMSFEDAVRGWLEGLATESSLRSLPPDLRRAAEAFLIPALNQGRVRAAHLRRA